MFGKTAVFALMVALGAAQNLAFLAQTGGFGLGGGDIQDQMILMNLVRLDSVNAPLARRLLQLDVTGREVVGNLARGINRVIIKKGNMYPLTLLDRVLKIKGQTPFSVHQMTASRNIENNWIQTEIDDKEILEDLIQVDNADPQIVDSLLLTDVVDRKITSDLAQAINQKTIQNGPAYPQILLQKLVQINGGSPFGQNTPFGGVPRGISGRTFSGAFGGAFERSFGGAFARSLARNNAFRGTTNPSNIFGGVF